MNTYTTPRCPKCSTLHVFRTFNTKTRLDDGYCTKCHYKGYFDDFLIAGDDFDNFDCDFDKDRYYQKKQSKWQH